MLQEWYKAEINNCDAQRRQFLERPQHHGLFPTTWSGNNVLGQSWHFTKSESDIRRSRSFFLRRDIDRHSLRGWHVEPHAQFNSSNKFQWLGRVSRYWWTYPPASLLSARRLHLPHLYHRLPAAVEHREEAWAPREDSSSEQRRRHSFSYRAKTVCDKIQKFYGNPSIYMN